jgi:hypothetical protein
MANNGNERSSAVARTLRILRHPKYFNQLSPEYKWEFTRRHPYYLRFWQWANKYWQWRRGEFDPATLNMVDRHDFYGSVGVLSLIMAIFDKYPDPSGDALKDSTFQSPFSNVAAKAATYCQLAHYLLTFLPEDVRRAVSHTYLRELAKETVSNDGLDLFQAVTRTITKRERDMMELGLHYIKGDEPLTDRLLHGLVDLGAPSLNAECPGIIWVDYHAPLEESLDQVKSTLQKWKKEFGALDVRRRPDKWGSYLKVWDAREGWNQGAYDGTRAKRLRDIAVEMRMDVATVQSHYESAYKLLIGREYCPTEWSALFGKLKVTKAKWDSWRRSKQQANDDALSRSIPESSINPAGSDAQNHIFMTEDNEGDYGELIQDLRTLIAKERSNEEIIMELELALTAEELETVRERLLEDV